MQDVRENVGAPSNQHRKRRSPDQYTDYMALMNKRVENEPSSFKEAVEKIVWVDAMVEEYESIAKNHVWEKIRRTTYKSILGSIRTDLWPRGTLKLRELTMRRHFLL